MMYTAQAVAILHTPSLGGNC